jgi:hypothetical protein
VINEIRNKLIGFECNRFTDGIESLWNRYYENRSYNDADYLKCLEKFLTKDKPIIDEVIKDAKNSEIGFLDQNKADRKIAVHDKNAISLKILQNISFIMNKATECTRSTNYRSD